MTDPPDHSTKTPVIDATSVLFGSEIEDHLSYPTFSNYTPTERQDDLHDVLNALLELHELENKNEYEQFSINQQSIIKAINLNAKIQKEVERQIQIIDDQLSINEELMLEAKQLALEENRCSTTVIIHKHYKSDVNYFDQDELLDSTSDRNTPNDIENRYNINLDLSKLKQDYIEEDEDNNDDDESQHADNEQLLQKKSWSLFERNRLAEAIRSEAQRLISIDFMKRNEAWRVWDVDKMKHTELESFPVERIDWDRISNLHVQTRTPTECLIQWTTQEHPSINKKPWTKSETERLSKLVDEIGLFSGQWERIANELNTSRTIAQCFSHYMSTKNNTAARSLKWSAEEDKKLAEAVKIFGDCNWQQVAAILKGRTGQQCLHRWSKTLKPGIVRKRWTVEDDEALQRAIHLYGVGNWTKIQRLVAGRTDMQCRERWANVLHPGINKGPMTQEESDKLVQLVQQYGKKWSLIARYMPGRTDNTLLRQYKAIMNRQAAEEKRKAREKEKEERKKAKEKEKEEKRKEQEGTEGKGQENRKKEKEKKQKEKGSTKKRGAQKRKRTPLQEENPIEISQNNDKETEALKDLENKVSNDNSESSVSNNLNQNNA
ncbi:uncharacterized protein BX663DRAFT_519740 [Cokeromyces recurvatus]|uniref:uncharacterized protein n=1 Tax=Cokeromyces recurvatus TaxID=90255 RepID=UPI0022202E11|nr:uncharacterized protein BX663DRAFT_519740 [Cokeromyces recurvatus]KAI7899860.1 hypothetical protein BX663DRAFT_519740 [Cokeromyces recurvatus]